MNQYNKRHPWSAYGWPKLQSDWVDKRIIINLPMRSGVMEVPAGKAGTITDVRSKENIHIILDQCDACGMAPRFTRVRWQNLRLEK